MVSSARTLVTWAIANQDANPDHVGLVGISMGGFLGTNLLATDSRLARAVLLLAGADMAGILEKTETAELVDRLKSYEKFGMTKRMIVEGMRRELTSDPVNMGRYVDPRGVLLIRGTLDSVIPAENSRLLWKLIGRPQRVDMFLGHYTAILALPYILGKINSHFRDWVPESQRQDDF